MTVAEGLGSGIGSRARPKLSRAARGAALVIVGVGAVALLAPVLPLDDPIRGELSERLSGPSFSHPLGTDGQGRDVLSRLVWGARPSMLAAMLPVLIGGSIGASLGLIAGLIGRTTGAVIMRFLDIFYAFPAVLLAIAIATTRGAGLTTMVIAIAVIVVAPVARIAETEVRAIRNLDFMEAARASGAPTWMIAVRQVVPCVGPALIVYCTALVGLSLVYAAGLGFIGLGLAPPDPEWGTMVNELRSFTFSHPWLAVIPAVVILSVSVAFNVLGDGLRDRLAVGGSDG